MKTSELTYSESSQQRFKTPEEDDYTFYAKSHFHHTLRIERQRTERCKKPFLLLLLDISALIAKEHHREIAEKIKFALASSLREVDVRGWYDENSVIGIILTEMISIDANSIEGITRKIFDRISASLDAEWVSKIRITFHIYPETDGNVFSKGELNINLYPDLMEGDIKKKVGLAVKSTVDILGSFTALVFLSPLFVLFAIAIKATSQGPVFFRQERLGFNGKPFSFLKFRSMYTHCDSDAHREYIKKYIGEQKNSAVEPGVFKLKGDRRITPVGRFLRKTSLDELPQLINVLKGEMSLVGPRPPIPYECDLYDIWHRRRLLSCKPGITGLWQVMGRSRTTFDEMVRLDLKYINEWSLWLDLKILLKTPKAILTGEGAY